MRKLLWILLALAVLRPVGRAEEEPPALAGRFEGPGFAFEFVEDRLFVSGEGEARTATRFVVKDGLLYVAPIIPPGERPTRNVWVVVAHDLQSMLDGQRGDPDVVLGNGCSGPAQSVSDGGVGEGRGLDHRKNRGGLGEGQKLGLALPAQP